MRLIFWLIFAVTMAIYLTMVLWSIPYIVSHAMGLMPFDLRFTGYDYEEAALFHEALSDEGRRFYLTVQHSLDGAYPGLMAVTLVMSFRALYQGATLYVASGFAVLAAVFDYLENASVAVMLKTLLIDLSKQMVARADLWTLLKSGAATLAFSAVLVGLVMAVIRRMRATR